MAKESNKEQDERESRIQHFYFYCCCRHCQHPSKPSTACFSQSPSCYPNDPTATSWHCHEWRHTRAPSTVTRHWHAHCFASCQTTGCREGADQGPWKISFMWHHGGHVWKVLPTETLTWPSPEIFHRDHERPVTWEAMADPAEQCRPSWTQAAPDPAGYKLLAQLLESSEEDNMVGILYDKIYENFMEEVDTTDNKTYQWKKGELWHTLATSLNAGAT